MMEMCWDLPGERKENGGKVGRRNKRTYCHFLKDGGAPPAIIVLEKVPPPPPPPPPRCSQTLKRSKRCRFGDPSL